MTTRSLFTESIKEKAKEIGVSDESMIIGWVIAMAQIKGEVTNHVWVEAGIKAKVANRSDKAKLEVIKDIGEDKFQVALQKWALEHLERSNIHCIGISSMISFQEYGQFLKLDLEVWQKATEWISSKWLNLSALNGFLGYGVAFRKLPLAIINVGSDGTGAKVIMRCQWKRLVRQLMQNFLK